MFILLHSALWDKLAQTDLSASVSGCTDLHPGSESHFLHRSVLCVEDKLFRRNCLCDIQVLTDSGSL